MYLKSVQMQGFKSFTDKTDLEFEGGIAAIVGPNGSGKSNISDAIKWVLGEQSAKSLRGSKMEDVIFSGTEKRNQVGYAQVVLTLDNTDKTLPVDFNEVSVTRRIYRSGESEYLINNATCRLKDINELFMDTGVGRDGYSIIGQGKIDEILSNKSEDRRQVFEEAAGISKYRYRRDDAQKKLAMTEDNLVRVSDIISELEKQLEPLSIQAEKTKQYFVLKDELRTLEVNIWVATISKNKEELDKVQADIDAISKEIEEAKDKMNKSQDETGSLYDEIAKTDELVEALREEVKTLERNNAAFDSEVSVLLNTLENNKVLRERIADELKEIEDERTELVKEKETLVAKKEYYVKKRETTDSKLKESTDKLAQIVAQETGRSEEIDSKKNEILDIMNEISDARVKMGAIETNARNLSDREDVLNEEIELRNKNIYGIEKTKQGFESELKNKNVLLQKFVKDVADGKAEIADIEKELDELEEEKQDILKELNDKNAKLKLFRDMEKSYDGYAGSVKSVMKAYDDGSLKGVSLFGTVGKLVDVPKEYNTAVSVSLGNHAQNIVTQSEADAKKAIKYLKDNNLGRATFMPVETVIGGVIDDKEFKGQPGYIGVLSELIRCDEKYVEVVRNLLGRIVLFDNIDNAAKMAAKNSYKTRIVTLGGEQVNIGGSFTGGSVNRNVNFLSKKDEIEKLEKLVKELERKLKGNETKCETLEKEKEEKIKELGKLEAVEREANDVVIKLEGEIKLQSIFLNNETKSLELLEEEIGQLGAQKEDCAKKTKELEERIKELENKISGMRKTIEEQESMSAAVVDEKSALAETISALTTELAVLDKDIESAQERIRMTESELEDAEEGYNKYNGELSEIDESDKVIGEKIQKGREDSALSIKAIEEKNDLIAQETKKRSEMEEKIRLFGDKNKEISETLYRLQGEAGKLESKHTKLEIELENIITKLWDEYELTPLSAKHYITDIGKHSEATKRINTLRRQIKELGSINPDAVEEYANVKERYEFLSGQKNDLTEAKENVTKIIEELTELMKKQFKEQFEVINREFATSFKNLFGGGHGELRLAEPDDVLSSGIEIDVQPPGKKLQSLSLLSGGERALSAIAILFAILKVRPTPFCVFDEIEAALDDVNVYRFANYVKQYNKDTQFIIITHRRGTMEAADVLYGVTMHEQGVSKLLKLDLSEVPL